MSLITGEMFNLGRLLPQSAHRPCSWKSTYDRWAMVRRLELKLERMAATGDARLKALLGIGAASKSVQPLRLRVASYMVYRLVRFGELSFSWRELSSLLGRHEFDDFLALRKTLQTMGCEKWLTCRHGFQLTGEFTDLLIGERLEHFTDDDVNCFFADLESENLFGGDEE